LQQLEEEFDGMEENMLLEDGSEAESPKLGTKKTYTQAKLDAAVMVDFGVGQKMKCHFRTFDWADWALDGHHAFTVFLDPHFAIKSTN
jgi:hypothetical protein